MSALLAFIQEMKHSPLQNYGGIPGLTSWLIGTPGPKGLVRLMECSRDHREPIVPHSHRFDLHCRVLAGSVRNVIWQRGHGDEFNAAELRASGPGVYTFTGRDGETDVCQWSPTEHRYCAGDEYSMLASEVHSIYFGRKTSVLFFEGSQVSDSSIILEPWVNGATVPTFTVEKWAFKREAP